MGNTQSKCLETTDSKWENRLEWNKRIGSKATWAILQELLIRPGVCISQIRQKRREIFRDFSADLADYGWSDFLALLY